VSEPFRLASDAVLPIFQGAFPLFRSARVGRNPVFFDAGPGGRWNDLPGEYGVLYAAEAFDGAVLVDDTAFPKAGQHSVGARAPVLRGLGQES
jgi:hypothetical protein